LRSRRRTQRQSSIRSDATGYGATGRDTGPRPAGSDASPPQRPVTARWGCRAAFGALLALAGCNTVDTLVDDGYTGPRTYSGTRRALSLAGQAFYRVNPYEVALWGGDALLCTAADTLLLPLTLPAQLRRNRDEEEHLRVDVEQPSVLRPIPGEDALSTAKRLFRECSSHLLNFSPQLPDCYSISAKITLEGDGEELSGADYKVRLREELLPLAGSMRFVRLRNPTFEERPPNVEVTARRLDSDTEERTPLMWLLGPGPDGGWRILEERGQGFLP
jgi:hypothetical protein